jgi:hypothetical protein
MVTTAPQRVKEAPHAPCPAASAGAGASPPPPAANRPISPPGSANHHHGDDLPIRRVPAAPAAAGLETHRGSSGAAAVDRATAPRSSASPRRRPRPRRFRRSASSPNRSDAAIPPEIARFKGPRAANDRPAAAGGLPSAARCPYSACSGCSDPATSCNHETPDPRHPRSGNVRPAVRTPWRPTMKPSHHQQFERRHIR